MGPLDPRKIVRVQGTPDVCYYSSLSAVFLWNDVHHSNWPLCHGTGVPWTLTKLYCEGPIAATRAYSASPVPLAGLRGGAPGRGEGRGYGVKKKKCGECG